MARVVRLVRFTGVLIIVAFIITYQLISKRKYQQILQLKAELNSNTYDINNDLTKSERTNEKIKYLKDTDIDDHVKVNATFMTLARNEDLWELSKTIRSYEDRFNNKFHYDWVFLNNEEFSDSFKLQISNLCSGKIHFVKIPKEYWDYPDWIDPKKAKQVRIASRERMIYGGSENYRFMCRFFSGLFYKLDIFNQYDYVWRVEPETSLHCDVNYDVFKYMVTNDKHYGFTITLREFPETIPTLWDNVKSFIELYPNLINNDNLLEFISFNDGKDYNLCHFWTNFEIVDLNFLRSEAYQTFFQFLDKANGFFYERWGDAPVHSIAVSLMLAKKQIHFFDDIGYFHSPMNNCPIDETIWKENNCLCDQNLDVTFRDYSCTNEYYEVQKKKKPALWQSHRGNGQHFG